MGKEILISFLPGSAIREWFYYSSKVVVLLLYFFSIIAARALHRLLILSLEYDFRMERIFLQISTFTAIDIQQKWRKDRPRMESSFNY